MASKHDASSVKKQSEVPAATTPKRTEPVSIESRSISMSQRSPSPTVGMDNALYMNFIPSQAMLSNHNIVTEEARPQDRRQQLLEPKKSIVFSTKRQSSELVHEDGHDEALGEVGMDGPEKFALSRILDSTAGEVAIPPGVAASVGSQIHHKVSQSSQLSLQEDQDLDAAHSVTFMHLKTVEITASARGRKEARGHATGVGSSQMSQRQRQANQSKGASRQPGQQPSTAEPHRGVTDRFKDKYIYRGTTSGVQDAEGHTSRYDNVRKGKLDKRPPDTQRQNPLMAHAGQRSDRDAKLGSSLNPQARTRTVRDVSIFSPMEEIVESNEPPKLIRLEDYGDKLNMTAAQQSSSPMVSTRERFYDGNDSKISKPVHDYLSPKLIGSHESPSPDQQTFSSRQDVQTSYKKDEEMLSEKAAAELKVFRKSFQKATEVLETPRRESNNSDTKDKRQPAADDDYDQKACKTSNNHGRDRNATAMRKSLASDPNDYAHMEECAAFSTLNIKRLPVAADAMAGIYQDKWPTPEQAPGAFGIKQKLPMNVVQIQFGESARPADERKKHSLPAGSNIYSLGLQSSDLLSPLLTQLATPASKQSIETQRTLANHEMKRR